MKISTAKKKYAEKVASYQNEWVALVDQQVVAHGRTLQEVKNQVDKKNITGYIFHFIAPRSILFAPYAV